MQRIVTLAVLLPLSMIVVGCQKAAEQAVESAIEAEAAKSGNKADVELDDESFSMNIQGEDGSQTVTFGKDTQLPKDFPEDVPLYPKQTINMAQTNAADEVFSIQAQVDATVAEVGDFYAKEAVARGWKEETTVNQGDRMRMLSYAKGEDRTLHVVIGSQDDGVTISLTTGKK